MYFGATNWIVFDDVESSVMLVPNGASTNHPGCIPVLYSVTVRITNGATAGPVGLQILAPGGGTDVDQVIVDLRTDFEADMTDTIHMTWPGGLPLYRISTTAISTTDAAYYQDKSRDGSAGDTFTIAPAVQDPGDTTMHGIVAYGYVPASMIK